MAVDPRSPCVIGVAQETWRSTFEGGEAPEPLNMWETVARAAATDASPTAGPQNLIELLESVQVVYCQSWQYDDPPGRLCDVLNTSPAHRFYSGLSGTTPQQLVNSTARSIIDGEMDLALIVGAEALATKRLLKKQDRKPDWSHKDPSKRPFPFEAPFIDTEIAHEVFQAWLTFALFDIGRRAHLGVDPDAYRRSIASVMAPLSERAVLNPLSWFPTSRTVDELMTPTADNRYVGYPYTKYEVAVMDVDMAAGLIVASHAKADELGIPPERRVYLRGWCYATDPTYVAEHHDFHSSPAMRAASTEALRMAGLGLDDLTHIDLYSCFASSLHYATDALGLAVDDPRGLSVTGGLPYFGGPGSNYMGHSIASMVEHLRTDEGDFGMVSGVGMHMTKHVYGVYSTQPPPAAIEPPDQAGVQARLDEQKMRAITDHATGAATVATYSVVHGRDGTPAWALLVCDLPDGSRCYARSNDLDLLVDLEAAEWVGRTVHLTDGGNNVNIASA